MRRLSSLVEVTCYSVLWLALLASALMVTGAVVEAVVLTLQYLRQGAQ